ncbi:MAG: nitrate reductase catalytic subunit [Candidatus Poribacteria bacterium]|nr:MAG: nitrate reductase catalytic subunit [Candidatus Poribacteria bacterium]
MSEPREERYTHGLSRRELLKLIGMASGMVITGPISAHGGLGSLWRRQPVVPVDEWHKGVCRFCGTGCGVMIGVKDGRIVDVKGDEYAHNKGRLCIKGILNRDILYTSDRALYPMIRHNGELKRATWDEAMELIVARFQEAIQQYGPDSVAFYGSGQLFTEESYTANKLFKAGIGTNNVEGNPRLCMASAAVGYLSVFGKDEPAGCYEDIDHADCFFITGSNTADCHPIIWERVMDRKRAHPETYLIVVDPRRTRTAKHADLHLPIYPGTDVALYNAMIHEFIRLGRIDQEMVQEYLTFRRGEETVTFEALRAHVQKYSPERVADLCGVPADLIRQAAYRFATARATMSLWTMGINQQSQGTAANRLLNAMHLLTGHFGRPGATSFSITGQPNAGGGVRDTGALAHALPNSRLVTNPEHRAEMEKLWGVPPGTINPKPGYHTIALFQAMERGDVKCVLCFCTNPGQSLPNVERYREAIRNTFFVAVDAFHPTRTTELASVVLPAAMWTEKEGVFSQSERRYHYVPKLVDPPGEARSDLEILVDFAVRMGYGDLIRARTPKEVWDEWRQISAHSPYNFAGITYERLKKERGILWPCPTEEHPGTRRRYLPGEDPMAQGNRRFDFYGRPDGRAVVWLHDQEPFQDPTDAEYPLILSTGRIYEHWHTMTITGKVPALRSVHPEWLMIHPLDAAEYGIQDGMEVIVKSRRGEQSFRAWITEEVRPGVVFTTFHSAKRLVNRTTADIVDPFSKQPEFKRCAVSVRPQEGSETAYEG